MSELLEVLHLSDDDRVPEVDVGRGRIEADLDRQRLAALQLRLQVVALDQVHRTFSEEIELFINTFCRYASYSNIEIISNDY